MDKIKNQASKVGQIIFAAETGAAYQKTLSLTWVILQETALLIWLVVCLFFVGAEWFWKTAIALGQRAKVAYTGLMQPSTEAKSFESISKSLLTAGENSAAFLLYQAKQQLGIDAEAPTPKTATAPPPVAPQPPVPAPPVVPAPPAPAPLADATEDPEI